jgi:gas vesicle protein
MADQTFRTTDQNGSASPQGFEKAATAAKSVADQALSAGRDLKDKAIGMVGSSSEAIKDQASEFVDAAKDVASQATDKLKQTVDGQKNAGAEYVGNLADTMRRAAREFDGDLPIAGVYIRKAASQIEGVSDSIKTGNFQDLVRGAQSFARRQPTAFLGMAVLAGFGVVRFLKTSANDSEGTAAGSRQTGGVRFAGSAASHSHADSGQNRSYADNEGYRNEFTR